MIRFPPTTSTLCWNRLPPERSRTRRLPKQKTPLTAAGADDDAGAPDIDDLDALIEQAAAAVPEQPQTPAAQKSNDPLSADDIDALLEQASRRNAAECGGSRSRRRR